MAVCQRIGYADFGFVVTDFGPALPLQLRPLQLRPPCAKHNDNSIATNHINNDTHNDDNRG